MTFILDHCAVYCRSGTMEVESVPSDENKPTHMSDTTAKVTDILSDRLGVLSTISSKERILFDIEELYLGGDKCDSSHPLSSYVTAGMTELQCDASFLPGNNKWNIWYKATCVWKDRKPPLTKIFDHHVSNCSAAGRLRPSHIYEGHIVQVSPPHAALAILTICKMPFPVLIFLNRLFKNSSLGEVQNCEWIQDCLNTGDKVQFKFGKNERSLHSKFHVAAFAWKSESEGQRELTDQQKIHQDSGLNEVKGHICDNQGDNTVSNIEALEVSISEVPCVGTPHVHVSSEISGNTSLTELQDKCNIDEAKTVTIVEASVPENMHLVLHGEREQMDYGIYTARERGCTKLSAVKSQESSTKMAVALPQDCVTEKTTHTKNEEPTAELLNLPVPGKTHDVPAVEHRTYGLSATLRQDGTQSVPGMLEDYGAVSVYRIVPAVQSEAEKSICLSGTGLVRNDCKVQTVHPQFSYELLKPPDEKEFNFRAILMGVVIFSYTVSGLPKSTNMHLPADDVLSKAGIRILSESSHEQCRMSKSSAAVGIELEMPLDSLESNHIAEPKIPSSSHAGMTACITGITLPEHVSRDVLTSTSNNCLQIPVCLEGLSPHNPTSEHKAVTLQGKFATNSRAIAEDSSGTVCDTQACDSDSWIQDTLSQEMASDSSSAFESELRGHLEDPMQTQKSSTSVWDTPAILVPVFVPLSLCSSNAHMSMLPSTRWTLISGSVAPEKQCLMYIPNSALSCSALNDKQCTQSPDQPFKDSFTSPEELSTSKPHSSHFGKYSGNIHSFGCDHVTVAFTVDGKVEKALFYWKKVYVNGIRIQSQSQLRDVVFIEMPVTLDVMRCEGKPFSYKATAVHIELKDEEQLEVCEADVVSVSGVSTTLSPKSLQKNSAVSMDQRATNFETYLALNCWDNFCAESFGVRKHMKDSVSRMCAYESNLNTENCKASTPGIITSAGKDTDTSTSISTARQETAVDSHLSEETSSIATSGIFKSEKKTVVPKDNQEKITASKSDTEFKTPGNVKRSQILDKMTESPNDPRELFTSKRNILDVASLLGHMPQSATQTTDKITVSDNDPGELFTSKTNTSDVASPLDLLPQSATKVAGVIDDVWMTNAVLMTATVKGVTLRVLIYGKNLHIKRQQCIVKNTSWQQLVQGMQVFANVSKLRVHPSGAVYLATSAWKGKKPGNGNPCKIRPCRTETCVNCLKKPLSSDDPSRSQSKEKSDAGRHISKHSKPEGIKYPTENTRICRKKPVLNDRSCSIQGKVDDCVEENEYKYHKALQCMKSLVGKKFVGTVERFSVDDGFGVVNFFLQNDKVKAVVFRQNIFANGISITDTYIKEKITAGRSVIVSAVKPYNREDIPYEVEIDTELQDRKTDPVTCCYSVTATCKNEQEEVTPAMQDMEFQSSQFIDNERETFYKTRLCYNWDKRNRTDSDKFKHIEMTNYPEKVKVEKLCLEEKVSEADVTASFDKRDIEITHSSDEALTDKPLCQEETVGDESLTASSDNKDIKVTYYFDEAKIDKPLCQEVTAGNAVVTPSAGNKQLLELPVTSTQHTGLVKQLKEKLARVKKYESCTRGILEYSISGAVVEVVFDKSVVKLRGKNEITDLRKHLPVDSIVYFDGEVVGEDSLLGCSEIVVTSVWESKTHKKSVNSKLTRSLTLELTFPTVHEGLLVGKRYEGVITKIHPPRAFVATVTEASKTYDVFVLNTFFSPAEYGMKLSANHSVLPYVDNGCKVHLVVNRTQEVNKRHTYEWFAVDAWTEEGDNMLTGSTPKSQFTPKELDDQQEGVLDVNHHVHQEGVIITLYPEWGVLNYDHLKDEVSFFARDTFLYGVRLTNVDLRRVFSPGYKLCFIMSEEPGLRKAHRVWLGSHDTPSHMHDISSRSMEIFSYCSSHKIDKSILATLIHKLGKQRQKLEVGGRIQTSSPAEEEENVWLERCGRTMAPARTGAALSNNNEQSNHEQEYCSEDWSDCDTDSVYVSDDREDSYDISCQETSVNQPESSQTGIPCSSSIAATVQDTSVRNTDGEVSFVSNLERAEYWSQNGSLPEGTANEGSEHNTLPIITETTENNGHIVPFTRTSNQQCMLHTQNRTLEDNCTHTAKVTGLSTDQSNITLCPNHCHLSVLHPEMHKTLRLLLCEALQKYNIGSDVLQQIESEAVTAVEEELKGVLMDNLLDRVLNKVIKLVPDSKTDKEATSRMFQTLREVSNEWKQKLSESLSVGFLATEQSREQEVVDHRTQLCSDQTQVIHVQVGGLIDKAVQTVSTGSILFLKLLSDS